MSNDDTNNPNNPNKARVRKGQSDGDYLLKLGAAGPTNKFQAKWAARAGRRAAVAERTNPYAASSSNESDDKPETNSPLPFPSARELWKEAEHSGACQRFKEWVKLAKLVMVIVPGSVGYECMFSAMKYLRNPQRKRLKQQHLTCCAR
eukprot:1090414-Pelagomonas_calceolata.AAC.1